MYVPISEDGIPFYSEGFVVRFYKTNSTDWVANFKAGWTSFSGVYDFPEFKRTVVFAFGQCYIMVDDEQKPLKAFGVGFTAVFQTTGNILIAADQTNFTIIEIDSDTVWHSERISWEGFKHLVLSEEYMTGLAYKPTSGDDEWEPFLLTTGRRKLLVEALICKIITGHDGSFGKQKIKNRQIINLHCI
jgi:hypothetical protein